MVCDSFLNIILNVVGYIYGFDQEEFNNLIGSLSQAPAAPSLAGMQSDSTENRSLASYFRLNQIIKIN